LSWDKGTFVGVDLHVKLGSWQWHPFHLGVKAVKTAQGQMSRDIHANSQPSSKKQNRKKK
jgi:hypothetical protein